MLCNFVAVRQRIVRAVSQPNAVGQRCFAVSNEAIPRQRKLPRLPNRRTAELDLNIVAERLIAAVDVQRRAGRDARVPAGGRFVQVAVGHIVGEREVNLRESFVQVIGKKPFFQRNAHSVVLRCTGTT